MANHTERNGVYFCGQVAEKKKWMFREQPIADIGIDAQMEYVDENGESRRLIALQIKSGSSYFKEIKDNAVIFRECNERQVNYWTRNTLPCILVLYNDQDGTCIWQKLTSETIKRTKDGKGSGFFIRVPLTQVFLDEDSNTELLQFSNLPEYIINYNFLLSQLPFMKVIQEGGTVILHSEEWVNKSSGRGTTELIVNDGTGTKKYRYPYWFPYTPYQEVFPRLFPWAAFRANGKFLYKQDNENWKKYNVYHDPETGEDICVGLTFEEFREKLNPMRYVDHSREVAEYMLDLSLNDLGKAFLKVNDYVSNHFTYTSARPKEKGDSHEED